MATDDFSNKLSFESFRNEILNDDRIVVKSRELSLNGRKEVLTGKAKYGLFGDGKELAQVALAKFFKKGDYYSGYYRDQTIMIALGLITCEQFFAQLYANTDIEKEPSSGGRMMGSHYATPFFDGQQWLNQTERFNIAAFLSPVASQLPKVVGLGLASKYYRDKSSYPFSENFAAGDEIVFASIGNAACSEGIFWECLNAIAVLQLPVVLSIWDDGYGISVPNSVQFPNGDLLKLLSGFNKTDERAGFEIIEVKGWDYAGLAEVYDGAVSKARTSCQPSIIYVKEVTQPTGHSTSGSHERYKSMERLQWEREWDCIKKFEEWTVDNFIALEDELTEIFEEVRNEVRNSKVTAWTEFMEPIENLRKESNQIFEKVAKGAEEDKIIKLLNSNREVLRRDVLDSASEVLHVLKTKQSPSSVELEKWIREKTETFEKLYERNLYTSNSALPPEVAPIYLEPAEYINGYEFLNRFYDTLLNKDPRVIIFGEDVGFIGGVNQAHAGLQEKYGADRVFDTGIRERTIVGQAIGLAMRGFRPIAEIQYLDYILSALQLLSDDLATLRWRTNGRQIAPVIISTRGHRLEGIWHSGSQLSALLSQLRGMNILVPRNMTQAAGLYNYLLADTDPNPTVIIEPLNSYRLKHRALLNYGDFKLRPGQAEILKAGSDITLVTYGYCCLLALEVSALMKDFNIEIEVIDVQSLIPFDISDLIINSVKKTKNIIFLDEDVPGGATAYMYQEVLESRSGFQWVEHPPLIITAKEHRPAYSADGDFFSKPGKNEILNKIFGYCSLHKLFAGKNKIEQVIERVKENRIPTLDLSNQGLTEIPAYIFELKHLQELNLSHNNISEIPPEIGKLAGLRNLTLSSNRIKNVSDKIGMLKKLEALDLADNELSEIPNGIMTLTQLKSLILQKNSIRHIPEALFELFFLENLDISFNGITNLPNSFTKLIRLTRFSIDNDKISNIPDEIIKKGIDAISSFLSAGTQSIVLREAKIVVCGQADVGKTSVMRRLIENKFYKKKGKTDGIEIKDWKFKTKQNVDINFKVWDLGGQEIYHATHQFFLTANSIYFIIWDANVGQESSRLTYWLYTVSTLTNNSPIIIVQNKIDQAKDDLDNKKLKEQFKNIVGIVDFSSYTGKGRIDVLTEIENSLTNLNGIERPWPPKWISVRRVLENVKAPYISHEAYLSLCNEKSLSHNEAKELLEFMSQIGELIYFPEDPVLSNVIFLDSNWLTKVVYAVFDSQIAKGKKGKLDPALLRQIWKNDVAENMQGHMLQVMKKFDMLFESSYNEFILPTFLPVETSETLWNYEFNTRCLYVYDVLPSGILSGFTVRMHDVIKKVGDSYCCWKNEVILQKGEAQALVRLNESKREISIFVSGSESANLLGIIRHTFENLNQKFKGIGIVEKIPCVCSDSCSQKYERDWLLSERRNGTRITTCPTTKNQVEIEEILYGSSHSVLSDLNKLPNRPRKAERVFISYSHKDKDIKIQLENHLAGLKAAELIKSWADHEILAGEEWDTRIKNALAASRIILFLISSDFLASEYINNVEIEKAIERHNQGQAVIVPIIARACDFKSFPAISKFQALPKQGKAIKSWADQDEAYLDIVDGLKAVIASIRSKSGIQ